jgi:peroxiredoxin
MNGYPTGDPRPVAHPLFAVAVAAVFLLGGWAYQRPLNEALSVGDAVPEFKDLPGTDGKTHSLSDFADKKVLVVVFTATSCLVAADYDQRIVDLAKSQPESVGVVAINSSRGPRDTMEAMTRHVEEKGFAVPYLKDEDQAVARSWGATGTPQFFVLSADRKIVYMGAFDDHVDPAKASKPYVSDAVAASLAGKSPETTETYAPGCRIRFARVRE